MSNPTRLARRGPPRVRPSPRPRGRPQLPTERAGWSKRRWRTYKRNHHTNVIREIQFDTWRSTRDTGLIATYDTNSNQSIHPAAKRPVGERAARWALSEVHKLQAATSRQPLPWKGPIYA